MSEWTPVTVAQVFLHQTKALQHTRILPKGKNSLIQFQSGDQERVGLLMFHLGTMEPVWFPEAKAKTLSNYTQLLGI